MAAQPNGPIPSPMYTIEQIELIRRLRNSGISKEQLIQAFDSLDRLDRELGPVYTIPLSMSQQAAFLQQAFQLRPLFTAPNLQTTALRSPLATPPVVVSAPPVVPPMTPQLAQHSQQQQTSRKRSIDSVESGGDCNGLSTSLDLSSTATNGYTDQLDEQEEKEFLDFVMKGEAYCCEEIRNFVIQYSIKQQQVATLSGISQSYVSRYLKGDFYDMSERSRRAIQKWFIVYRKNPAAIAPAVNAILLSNGPSPKKLVNNMDLSQDFTCYPKRERFVFRPNHIEILERCFQEDSYPTYEKREEIARNCNTATEAMTGRELADKEKVTVQVVSNWFANKRKEMKKIAREEGLDVSQVPLRPRGRPPRVLSDIIAQLANSQSQANIAGLGLSQEAVNHAVSQATTTAAAQLAQQQQQQQEQQKQASSVDQLPASVNLVTVVSPSTASSAQEVGSSGQAGILESPEVVVNGSSHQATAAGSRQQEQELPTPEANGDTNGASPALRSPDPNEDQNLSLSVELAAVNQAILSLTGQQPIGVKVEKQAENSKKES